MNNDNLVSLADRTTDERREIARAGGIASGESRRRRKTIREVLEQYLDTQDEDGMTYAEKMCLAMVKRACDGDVKAFIEVRNSVGERPAEIIHADTISPEDRAEMDALLFGVSMNESEPI
jgi:hypothetical protein